MISINNIHLSFSKNHKLFDDLSLKIADNSLTGVIGPTGHGKSVLFKVISGLQSVDSGTVGLDSADVGFMFQEGALFDSLSVLDNVAFPLTGGRVPVVTLSKDQRDIVSQRAYEILKRVGLAKATHKLPGQLSGGMKKRLSLARALVSNPKIALLDDPTSGLDPIASKIIMNLIAEIQDEYDITVLVISHDLRRLLPCVKNIAALFDKKIRFHGTVKELMENADPEVKHFVECRYLYEY